MSIQAKMIRLAVKLREEAEEFRPYGNDISEALDRLAEDITRDFCSSSVLPVLPDDNKKEHSGNINGRVKPRMVITSGGKRILKEDIGEPFSLQASNQVFEIEKEVDDVGLGMEELDHILQKMKTTAINVGPQTQPVEHQPERNAPLRARLGNLLRG